MKRNRETKRKTWSTHLTKLPPGISHGGSPSGFLFTAKCLALFPGVLSTHHDTPRTSKHYLGSFMTFYSMQSSASRCVLVIALASSRETGLDTCQVTCFRVIYDRPSTQTHVHSAPIATTHVDTSLLDIFRRNLGTDPCCDHPGLFSRSLCQERDYTDAGSSE